ncbi:MAG: peptidase M20, partial [Sphingobium phenoxybenzoativorans]
MIIGVLLLGAGCTSLPLEAGDPRTPKAAGAVDPERLSSITRMLASDAFEGRSPGSAGETRTVDYLVEQFKGLGLEPGGDKGGWTQTVPLLRTQLDQSRPVTMTLKGADQALAQGRDIYISTLRDADHVQLSAAPMVFVGYGVTAPERDWDDFKGIDLKGKVAVFLVN